MASLIQILGATAISIGAGMIFLPAGIIAAGVFTIFIGISLERNV